MIEILPNWHPLLVHFAVALLLTAAALHVVAAFAGGSPVGRAATLVARWNLALGLLAVVPTLATGWQAYNSVAHDAPSHANMTVHMRWAFGSAALFAAAGAAAWFDRNRSAGAGPAVLALLVVGSGALAVTGWLGGENVYRYGLGVMNLPTVERHRHPGTIGAQDDGAPAHPHGAPVPGGEKAPVDPSTNTEAPYEMPADSAPGHAHSH